jgi:hypothetical protein
VTATANDTGGIDVSWTAAEGATSYDVSATAEGGTPVTTTVQAPAISATLSGLASGTTYTVSVSAKNAAGTTPAAETASVTTGAAVAPGDFTLTRVLPGHESVTAEWTAAAAGNTASPVTGYDLVATPAAGAAVTTTVTGLTGTVTGLTNGVDYTVTVVAKSGSAATTATKPASVTNVVKPNDVVTVSRAQYRSDKREYRIQGTAADTTDNRVTVALSSGQLIAQNVAVAADGSWSIDLRNGPIPSRTTITLTVTSSSGASLTNVALTRSR